MEACLASAQRLWVCAGLIIRQSRRGGVLGLHAHLLSGLCCIVGCASGLVLE